MSAVHKIGVGASLACAVHCMALPLAAGFAAVQHAHSHGMDWIELSCVGLAAAIGYPALLVGLRRHGLPFPLIMLTCGLALMVLGHLPGPTSMGASAPVAGALLVAAAQIVNLRARGACC